MSFLLLYTFNCVYRIHVIQLIIILLIFQNHSIASTSTQNHSIDFNRDHSIALIGNHSIASAWISSILTIPVTTRSMVKQQICLSETTNDTPSVNLELEDILHTVPELADPSVSSSSSSADSSMAWSDNEEFEISNFQNFDIISNSSNALILHNFEITTPLKMEPDCADTKAAVRTDPTMLTQDSIFKMLDAISSQMLQNYQTLQVQLTQTAEDVRRISQDNDTFRQEIRNELDTIRSSTVLSGNNPGIQPNAVLSVTASPPLIQSAVTPSASTTVSTSSSNSVDFQSQMLLMLNETFSKLWRLKLQILNQNGQNSRAIPSASGPGI